jgi:hypothetical protein
MTEPDDETPTDDAAACDGGADGAADAAAVDTPGAEDTTE